MELLFNFSKFGVMGWISILFLSLLQLLDPCLAYPLCTDSSRFHFTFSCWWFSSSFAKRKSTGILIFLFCCLFMWCTGAPFASQTPLAFCPYNGTVCCSSADDLRIQKQFQAMNISSNGCAILLKSILCAVRIYIYMFVCVQISFWIIWK